MERIEILINRLKEQFEQKLPTSVLADTVSLLQFELERLAPGGRQSLGTKKVAVVLPAMARKEPIAMQADWEKYLPQEKSRPETDAAVAEPVVERIAYQLQDEPEEEFKPYQPHKEFDPMLEIPTLAQQVKQIEVNDNTLQQESLNDRLKQSSGELMEKLGDSPVKDLRKAIGINDRFVFINDLFRGDEAMYERSIKTINGFNIYAEAEYWITRELKTKIGWDKNNINVAHFDQLVKRRFA